MAPYQNRKTAQSDLLIPTAEHGEIAIELKWHTLNDRLEVFSVTITPHDPDTPVEAVLMRRIPWAQLIRDERQKLSSPAQTHEHQVRHPRGPDSTSDLNDSDLEHVAELYLKAWQLNLPVQKHVAMNLNIAIPTAARRIGLARRRGLISRDINPPTRKKDK